MVIIAAASNAQIVILLAAVTIIVINLGRHLLPRCLEGHEVGPRLVQGSLALQKGLPHP